MKSIFKEIFLKLIFQDLFIYFILGVQVHGMWKFWAKDQTHATAATQATAVTVPDP